MRAVDLFCGCGGLSLGFQLAGIGVLAAYDIWPDALATYRANFTHEAHSLDLSDAAAAIAAVQGHTPDIIIGGPPCQDFSSAGKRDEENGRGDLTVRYADIVCAVRSEWFMMENVPRITRSQKLATAEQRFRAAGYGLTSIVLDASLCGVPQRRNRFIMVGRLGERDDFLLEALTAHCARTPLSVAAYFGDKLPLSHYYRHPRSYARRGIFSTQEPSPTVRGVNRPIPSGYRIHPGDGVESLEGIRPLTSRERSMIQTFPEEFRFVGTQSSVEQMIGNAVPVNLARHVARAILEYCAS